MVAEDDERIPAAAARPSAFPATRLSVCEAVRSGDPAVRRVGWDALVEAYWKPVCRYVRLRWRADGEEAADLTQGFFARALEKEFFESFDPQRARFRTFLRVCLDGFVANVRQSGARLKRGGGAASVALDVAALESTATDAALQTDDDLDACFHREWVRALFDAAIGDLEARCEAEGKRQHFELFRKRDLEAAESDAPPSYGELARASGLPVTQVTNHLAWARRALREAVLARLRALCASEQEFRDEARALLGFTPS
jgi:DNA-directed RNA polymerase specialized sigma24 family protein